MTEFSDMMKDCFDQDKCEGTAAPYWLIIDPSMVKLSNYHNRSHYIASAITGPFLSRESANQRLRNASHHYSKHAIVYCASGHACIDWCELVKLAKKEATK